MYIYTDFSPKQWSLQWTLLPVGLLQILFSLCFADTVLLWVLSVSLTLFRSPRNFLYCFQTFSLLILSIPVVLNTVSMLISSTFLSTSGFSSDPQTHLSNHLLNNITWNFTKVSNLRVLKKECVAFLTQCHFSSDLGHLTKQAHHLPRFSSLQPESQMGYARTLSPRTSPTSKSCCSYSERHLRSPHFCHLLGPALVQPTTITLSTTAACPLASQLLPWSFFWAILITANIIF